MILYRIAGLLKKDWKLLMANKSYLILAILLPMLVGTVFLLALNHTPKNVRVGVCGNVTLPLNGIGGNVILVPLNSGNSNCTALLLEDVRSGRVNVGIVFPRDFEEKIERYERAEIVLVVDNTKPAMRGLAENLAEKMVEEYAYHLRSSLKEDMEQKINLLKSALTVLQSVIASAPYGSLLSRTIDLVMKRFDDLQKLDLEFFVRPAKVVVLYTNPDLNEMGSVFIYTFPVVAFFSISMLAAVGVIFERKNGFFSRIAPASIPYPFYLLSKLLVFSLLSLIQFITLFLLFMAGGGRYPLNLSAVLPTLEALLIISSLYALIGIVIGNLARESGEAILICLVLALPMTFLTQLFYPVDLLPEKIATLISLMPVNYGGELLKAGMLGTESVLTLSRLTIIAVMTLLAYISYAVSGKK